MSNEDSPRAPVVALQQPPMCAVHAALDREDTLELEVGNDCIACSLHERTALLNLLEPFAAEDRSQDSLTVLRNVIASGASSPASSPTPLADAVIEVIAAEGGPVPTKWRKPDPSSPVPPEQETETCPVCKNQVPINSLLSYNNVPNAICQECAGESPAAMPTPVEQEAMQLELKIAKEFIAEHVGVEPEIEYEPKEID